MERPLIRGLMTATLGLVLVAGFLASMPRAEANFGSQGTCGVDVGMSDADPFRSCVSLANNEWHAVRFSALGDQWIGIKGATSWTVVNNYDPTDLVAYVTTTDSLPDVWVYDYWYGNNGVFGWVDCPADNTGTGSYGPSLRWCRGQELRFNASMSSSLPGGVAGRQGLACHEMGHTVGLRHTTDSSSCLATSDVNFPPVNSLSDHDTEDHINPFY